MHKTSSTAIPPTLRHLEQLMARLLDGVIVIDTAGTILSANVAALDMHGVDALDDLGGTAEGYAQRFSLRSADHKPLRHREYPLFKLLAGEAFPDLVVEVASAGDDQVRWVHRVRDVVLDVDGGEPDYLALVLSDVSDGFDAEARFKAMFESNPAPAIIVRLDDQRVAQVNPGFLDLTKFHAEQLVGKSFWGLDLITDEPARTALRGALDGGSILRQTEAELRLADGSRRLIVFAAQPIDVTDDDGLLLTFADLEPRRQALDALGASERQLTAIFKMAPVAMMVSRSDGGHITNVNAAFRTLTGHDDGDAIGRTADDLRLWPAAGELHQDPPPDPPVRDRPVQLRTSADVVIDCLVSTEMIVMDGSASILWVIHDVSERRRNELELAEAIEQVMKDTSWLSRSILDKLATVRRGTAPAQAVELSKRERQILELICDDLDDPAIADALSISRNTVRNHVANIYAKIGVNRRSGAVVWGRERGMGNPQNSGVG
ncbi:PAS domain S-box protein [Sphingomonas aliaeris]|uniref:PAS domain S-box protein n=1 Tax=Sphingomonas aliaeris TaxID=2759526 RepID=A0A974NVW1_9SPHN|nr:helix-turn-helix transcriptional regulator [Sphingomonas aliaeris]QQV77767.1 PAS domain S-box protein [Sphingomonas aliaeris]